MDFESTKWNDVNSRQQNGWTYVAVTVPINVPDGLLVRSNADFGAVQEHIQKHGLKKVYLEHLADFTFLSACPCIEHVLVHLRHPQSYIGQPAFTFDYQVEPFYALSNLKSLSIISTELPNSHTRFTLDLSMFPRLCQYQGEYQFVASLESAASLQTLRLDQYPGQSLEALHRLENIDMLHLSAAKLRSLRGISAFNKLRSLTLSYCRTLCDMEELKSVKSTLKFLRIEKCSRIHDFSSLAALENLEYLILDCNQAVDDLSFLSSMKHLKAFVFSVRVSNGDLTPCLSIPFVHCCKGYQNYNLRPDDLPRDTDFQLTINDGIEDWRILD